MVRRVSLGPDEVHAALVRERFSVANLRVQIRIAEQALEELTDFERRWARFERVLGATLNGCERGRLSLWGPKLADGLASADDARLDLASRQPALFPDCRDPLAKFLRTGVRTFSPALWDLIGETYVDEDGNDVLVPVDDDGNEIYEVSVRRFEINALEARVRKQRTMLEEAERAVAEEHARDLEKLRAASLTHLTWHKFREGRLGRVVWWFVEEPLRNLLWAGVLALVVVPPIRDTLLALLRWLGSLFR